MEILNNILIIILLLSMKMMLLRHISNAIKGNVRILKMKLMLKSIPIDRKLF